MHYTPHLYVVLSLPPRNAQGGGFCGLVFNTLFRHLWSTRTPPQTHFFEPNIFLIDKTHGQVLVLSHPLSNTEEIDSYLAERLYPVRPLVFWGRSAKAEPVVKSDLSVQSWWEDRLSVIFLRVLPHLSLPPLCRFLSLSLSLNGLFLPLSHVCSVVCVISFLMLP